MHASRNLQNSSCMKSLISTLVSVLLCKNSSWSSKSTKEVCMLDNPSWLSGTQVHIAFVGEKNEIFEAFHILLACQSAEQWKRNVLHAFCGISLLKLLVQNYMSTALNLSSAVRFHCHSLGLVMTERLLLKARGWLRHIYRILLFVQRARWA